MRISAFVAALALAGCSSPKQGAEDSSVDAASIDAGHDAAKVDSGFDAGHDAGTTDAGHDAGYDAGPTCECSAGACCDGCHFRGTNYVCDADAVQFTTCTSASICMPYGNAVRTVRGDRHCVVGSTACTGTWTDTHYVDVDCSSSQGFPTYSRCVDPAIGDAYCTWGPNCATEHP